MANTKIHGSITSLSPIKKGRNSVFFDGTPADGASKIRVVDFDYPMLHWGPSDTVEYDVQEIGRTGRNGQAAGAL